MYLYSILYTKIYYFLEHKNPFRFNVTKPLHVLGILGLGTSIYYISHLETVPLSNRKRFMSVNEQQVQELSEIQYKELLLQMKNALLSDWDPTVIRVGKIAEQLIQGEL
jgi:hypothetical protein